MMDDIVNYGKTVEVVLGSTGTTVKINKVTSKIVNFVEAIAPKKIKCKEADVERTKAETVKETAQVKVADVKTATEAEVVEPEIPLTRDNMTVVEEAPVNHGYSFEEPKVEEHKPYSGTYVAPSYDVFSTKPTKRAIEEANTYESNDIPKFKQLAPETIIEQERRRLEGNKDDYPRANEVIARCDDKMKEHLGEIANLDIACNTLEDKIKALNEELSNNRKEQENIRARMAKECEEYLKATKLAENADKIEIEIYKKQQEVSNLEKQIPMGLLKVSVTEESAKTPVAVVKTEKNAFDVFREQEERFETEKYDFSKRAA